MTDAAAKSGEQILDEARAERDRIEAELREINSKLEQSRGEMERLAKNNAKVTSELKSMEKDFESVPRATLKEVYEAAQDAQQRLFVMRGQVDKLQAEQANLKRYLGTLEGLLQITSEAPAGKEGPGDEELPAVKTVVRIIDAQEKERKRLANQMHDGPAHALTNFILQAEICQRLFDKDTARTREELANLKNSASSTFQKVRDFIFDLRPMMLDDLGLVPTVRRYVEAYGEKSGITTNLQVTGTTDRRLEAHREVILFRALQELMANVRDHAQATEATIMLDMGDVGSPQVRASVEDNGQGFGTGELAEAGGRAMKGLETLQERVALIGGEVHIDSGSGRGTRIVMSIPAGPPV